MFTDRDFAEFLKNTTLEQRLAYVKEKKEQDRKASAMQAKLLFDENSIDNWDISEEWVLFKKENGINCIKDTRHIGYIPYSDFEKVFFNGIFTFISTATDLPPYQKIPKKTQIGRYDLSVTPEELINESIKFLAAYDKHQNAELGIFYILKKEVKNKPKTTLF